MVRDKTVAIDTETKSLTDKTLTVFSISYETANGQITEVFPMEHHKTKNMDKKQTLSFLIQLIEDNKIVFHNSSFDIPVLVQFGVPIESFIDVDDTLVMANLINENGQHGLKQLVKEMFKHQMAEYKDVCGTGKKHVPFEDVDWKTAKEYAGQDAYWTLRLYKKLSPLLSQDQKLRDLYYAIEKPLLLVIGDMHCNGINIDVKKIKSITEFCSEKMVLAEEKLKILMGDINFNSHKQLKEYFIDKCNMPKLEFSDKTNEPSVNHDVLEIYAETNNEAKLLLEYRRYAKILSTFVPALTPEKWDLGSWTGKIHASFNQAGTVSGRFSSSRPNMQNIPRKDEIGIRQCIIADDGQILIGADYSQIELRILAHFSKDRNLIKAYVDGKDIHQQTADACGVERQQAKTINFGLVYGMRSRTLAKQLNVRPEMAQQYIDRYFQSYTGVTSFWEEAEKQVRGRGYVETAIGRKRRRSSYFHTKDDYDQGAEIRSMTNSIIQGTAADLIKQAMVSMYPLLRKINARIILTCHDEVLVSSPLEHAKKAYEIIKSTMLNAGKYLDVPIDTSIKYGRNWEEAHGDGIKLEEFRHEDSNKGE